MMLADGDLDADGEIKYDELIPALYQGVQQGSKFSSLWKNIQ